jgi:type VI secretion system protein ImpA
MGSRSDSQTLLEPITAEAPCGESLEDTQLLASFDGFRVFGQATPLDPVPDWSEIRNRSIEALRRSKDLRVLAYFASAVLRTDGFPAFADTLRVAAAWLETYWSGVHPLVTEDAIVRRNALNCLADPMGVVDGLRRVPLVSSRVHGTFSLRDIDIATGQLTPRDGDARPSEDQIKAAIAAMPAEDLAELHESVAAARAALKTMTAQMRDAAGSDSAPEFDALAAQLVKIDKVLGGPPVPAQPVSAGDDTAALSAAGAAALPVQAVGVIRSRQDAIAALDAVATFFRRTEPSSPIPLFLERAKRLVSKDFFEVLADIAPDAVSQARIASGVREE